MKRDECLNKNIDRFVFDHIAKVFGENATNDLDPKDVETIRIMAYKSMSKIVSEFGPIKGLFEDAIEHGYKIHLLLKNNRKGA